MAGAWRLVVHTEGGGAEEGAGDWGCVLFAFRPFLGVPSGRQVT